MKSDFKELLKRFFHDPIDKCIDIQGHESRAKKYAEMIGISNLEDATGPDQIASCMERSFLSKDKKIYQDFTEIRHPFSEGKIVLSDEEVSSFNKDIIFQKVEEIFKEIAKSTDFPRLDQERFLYLWRNLVELTWEKFKDEHIGKFIPILPADTRIPDHSIWEHLKISSATKAYWDKENNLLLQNNSLFLFSIGPVQSFISQARKTQDLFMGSFILSYLTFKAIESIIEEFGPTNIIYPDLHGQPLMDYYLNCKKVDVRNSTVFHINQPTIPNRFVALIPETDVNKIRELAIKAEEAVKREWMEMVDTVLKAFGLKGEIGEELIEKQNKNFPEIYWVAIPLKKDTRDVDPSDFSDFFDDEIIKKWNNILDFVKEKSEFPPNIGLLYQLAYSALEKSMGARKNLRDFEQAEELGKKCHLCGEREGVIHADKGTLKVGKYISSTERLCVRCFTKRALDKYIEKKFGFRFKDLSFPSTAEVACSDFKERALKEAKQEFQDYINTFKEVLGEKINQVSVSFLPKVEMASENIENLEGEWFFEENLREKEFKDQFDLVVSQSYINDELRQRLKNLTDKIGKPNSYYAVIMLDGDSMGKWLSGEKLPSIEHAYNSETWEKLLDNFKNGLDKKIGKKILTPAIHASISNALKNYSLEIVRQVVEEEHIGKLVYSGGDDVLALVNLKDLFEVLRKLRAGFSGQIRFNRGKIEVDWDNTSGFVDKNNRYLLTMGPFASLSCGIVIAHYKAPLKLVLDKVREAEKKAKSLEDKDAFCVVLMKHSGQTKEFACKWRFKIGILI